jgi:hypothetical protein
MGGLRSLLGNYGVSLGLQNTAEVFGNVARPEWSRHGV